MPISASAMSDTLDHAFRAAFLLTGSAASAENAVAHGIATLEQSDDAEKAVVAETIAYVMRQFPTGLEPALAQLPDELHRVIHLDPVSRDCFLLRNFFGIAPARCAAILNLTIEEFEDSLHAAFERLPFVGALIYSPGPLHQTEGAPQ
jgi:hypothetical protein